MSWTDLFPEHDYGFQLRLERGDPARFFGNTADRASILEERRLWIGTEPGRCVVLTPNGVNALRETAELALQWGTADPSITPARVELDDPMSVCQALGAAWEPDFLILLPDAAKRFRVVAAIVCFPSSWDVTEKTGLSVGEIHGVVPGLNEALEDSINTFLARMRPGVAWQRANWGLSASADRNQHPSRNLQRLQTPLDPARVFVRIERQALVALPRTGGVLFGIRLETVPLPDLLAHPPSARGFRRALQTLPEAMAQYKNMAHVRQELLELTN